MELNDIADLAIDTMNQYELWDWSFKWDRAKRRLGQCRYVEHEIGLSLPLFEIIENRPQAENTILHEVAHALAGPGAGHGPLWKKIARQVGADPKRCSDNVVAAPPTWAGTCECGIPHGRHRLSKNSRYWCKACRGLVVWSRS